MELLSIGVTYAETLLLHVSEIAVLFEFYFNHHTIYKDVVFIFNEFTYVLEINDRNSMTLCLFTIPTVDTGVGLKDVSNVSFSLAMEVIYCQMIWPRGYN